MARIETWDKLPAAIRDHLIERMRERSISIADLNQLRLWIESNPEVPDGDWHKDFGSFKICGQGPLPKTFLLLEQAAKGTSV
jgi:hypothetical protein